MFIFTTLPIAEVKSLDRNRDQCKLLVQRYINSDILYVSQIFECLLALFICFCKLNFQLKLLHVYGIRQEGIPGLSLERINSTV